MKIAIAVLLIASTSAFAPSAPTFTRCSALNVVTGPKGSAAKTAQEDLDLTREVILKFVDDDEEESSEDED
eukprot:CAMPEP_0184855632 /NCGR_PEP_ID=MMETSP0580-20130426/811_1 /TAXON_ID=1118495 /ORGANISM="Dactyliosolen fragilissimus" /LENGTH=70 /DNA_ID=CAMNT_0027350187 /DNA_START=56 /DNA_END=268 /DNA_ORIENTATION=+